MTKQPQQTKGLAYRPDLDGLRAVAVLLVLFDHLHTRVRGGYIGVDVFFVLSGYLISSVILSEMAQGRFSLLMFYERRIRRIFPALIVTLAVTGLLAYRYFVPTEMEAFALSGLAALGSVSNLLFWRQAGYFDAPSALKPLLHTWSLGVEEQFYLLFPLLLVAVRRWMPRRLEQTIWAMLVLSFAGALFFVQHAPAAAFFVAPLRAWELLLGTVLSQRYVPALRTALERNTAAAAGLLLILVPALLYTATTHFPGLAAVPPCLGAALIIAAGETGSSITGRALGWPPIVFVGLISYSLYLWHWPILTFQNSSYMLGAAPPGSKTVKVAVFVASMLAATISWLLVETPFRKGRLRPGRKSLFVTTAATAGALTVAACFALLTHGWPSRFPAEALIVDQYNRYDATSAFRENACFIAEHSTLADFNRQRCLHEELGKKQFLLIGDSHAAHLYPGLMTVFPEVNIMQANLASCRPFLVQPPGTGADCIAMWQYIYREYLPRHPVDAVLIAGRWDETDFEQLGKAVAWVKQLGLRVIVFGPVMEFDIPLPRLLTLALRDRNDAEVERHRPAQPQETDKKLRLLSRNAWKVEYISAFEDLCYPPAQNMASIQIESEKSCPLYASPGVPLLFDTDHFTVPASILYAQRIRERGQLP